MTPATTAALTAEHDRLTRYIHGHFKRKLSLEDAADAASEAIAEAERCAEPIRDRDKWLRRAAWRNALDQIRKVEGEGQAPRERPAGLGDDVDRVPGTDSTDDLALAAALHDADSRALAKATRSLKPDEHRVLHLRYVDGLDVPIILELIGCSRHHYDNLHKRGLRKLREALVAPADNAACREARGFILASALGGLDDDDAARRDAHLSGCLSCRAFSKRRDGLIAALPVPAVPALLSRVVAFFAGGAAPAKVAVVCGAGACAVAPIAAPVIERDLGHAHKAPASATRTAPTTTRSAAAVTPPAPTVSVARLSTVKTTTASASSSANATSAKRARRASSARARRSSSPFLPEDASAPRRPSASAPTRQATTAARRAASPQLPSPAPDAGRSAPSSSSSSSFADEFTP